jgi:hypothetical protein
VSGDYRQQDLPEGARLRDRPIAATEVHLLLDGLLLIEIDQQPVLEVGPGAIFDPATRPQYSKEHATVRALTPCRLAVLSRDQLDSQALLDSAAEQASRLNAYLENRDRRQSLYLVVHCRMAVESAANKTNLQTAYGGPYGGSIASTAIPPTVGGYSKFDLYNALSQAER